MYKVIRAFWLAHCLLKFICLPILLHDLGLFKYEPAFLVLLGLLIGPLVLPPEHLLAITAMDVGDRVEPCHELPVLLGPCGDVHGVVGEKRAAIPSLQQQPEEQRYY